MIELDWGFWAAAAIVPLIVLIVRARRGHW
jgi:hypothetical protein